MSAPQTLRVLDAECRVLRLPGSGKYEAIGKRWEMPACEPPSDAAMQAHQAYLARGGVRCVRGSDREQDAERVTND